jgi:protein required for attachment to host cells
MGTLWIVVADAGRAKILSKVEGVKGVTLVQEIDNAPGRAHTHDLVSDQSGRFNMHGTAAKSAADPGTDPHEEKAVEFARHLDHLLEAAAGRDEYQMLALVAPAHFLGLLNAGLKTAAKQRLALHRVHDLARFSVPEIESHLGDVLQYSSLAFSRK